MRDLACLIALVTVTAAATAGCARLEASPMSMASTAQCPDVPADQFLGQVKPVLYVADVQKSAPFFRDVLGFQFLHFSGDQDNPYYAEMLAGTMKFGLHVPGDDREQERVGKQRLYFRVRDVEAQRKRVAACGGDPGRIIVTSYMTMFSVTDPDGHQITFAQTDPTVHSYDPWN